MMQISEVLNATRLEILILPIEKVNFSLTFNVLTCKFLGKDGVVRNLIPTLLNLIPTLLNLIPTALNLIPTTLNLIKTNNVYVAAMGNDSRTCYFCGKRFTHVLRLLETINAVVLSPSWYCLRSYYRVACIAVLFCCCLLGCYHLVSTFSVSVHSTQL
ncbi:uncharacterized protein LOC131603520 [Vicia villosa]|uniref:uncharacterized protein LOC131603520 n=1 Tax=Vicia villosa TaxID=3911 RepID=UPI00273AEBF6|nr:uncharacterized protein LOC131603520 [Vicia villosa]